MEGNELFWVFLYINIKVVLKGPQQIIIGKVEKKLLILWMKVSHPHLVSSVSFYIPKDRCYYIGCSIWQMCECGLRNK